MSDLESIIVTIRSSGERTEQACIQSVLDQGVSDSQIHVIREVPFKKALEVCFQKASKSNAKWLLTLDADMILIPGVLSRFFQQAEKMPTQFIQIQAQIFDKFYGEIRRGGPRMYRVEYLDKALKISRSLNDHIRPETNIIQHMGKMGHPSRYISPAIALHDFEQYYRDIYRKACVYAVKHLKKIPVFLKQATKEVSKDPDYQVILKGIYDSLAKNLEAKIDKRMFKEEAEKALIELDLHEKEYNVKKTDLDPILKKIQKRTSLDFEIEHTKDVPSSRLNSFEKVIKRNGPIRAIIIYSGLFFLSLGKNLKRLGSK